MSILNDNKRNGFSFSNLLVLFCAAYRGVFNGWIVHPCAWTCVYFSQYVSFIKNMITPWFRTDQLSSVGVHETLSGQLTASLKGKIKCIVALVPELVLLTVYQGWLDWHHICLDFCKWSCYWHVGASSSQPPKKKV